MTDLHILNTSSTPEIQFFTSGNLTIKGISRSENSTHFYKEALNWLFVYSEVKPRPTVLNLNFTYLDTASVRCMVEIIRAIQSLASIGFSTTINWYYETMDEDLYEVGESLQSIAKVTMNLVEMAEDEGSVFLKLKKSN